jgi:hypothetical protein
MLACSPLIAVPIVPNNPKIALDKFQPGEYLATRSSPNWFNN